MGPVKTLEVPQDILDTARLTIDDLKVEMAVYLYAQGRLSIGNVELHVELAQKIEVTNGSQVRQRRRVADDDHRRPMARRVATSSSRSVTS